MVEVVSPEQCRSAEGSIFHYASRFFGLLILAIALLQIVSCGPPAAGAPKTAPQNVKLVRGEGTLVVFWNGVPDATGYRLHYRGGGGEADRPLAIGPSPVDLGDVTESLVLGLAPGGTYAIQISSYNARGESPLSGVVQTTVHPFTGVPLSPRRLRMHVTTKGLHFDWRPSEGAAGYRLYYGPKDSTPPFGGRDAEEGPSPITVRDALDTTLTGVGDWKNLGVAVSAFNSRGESAKMEMMDTVQLESEAVSQHGGEVVEDPTASGGQAVMLSKPFNPGWAPLWGPEIKHPQGRYEATFLFRFEPLRWPTRFVPDQPITIFNVWGSSDTIKVERPLWAKSGRERTPYREYSLEFETGGEDLLQFRLLHRNPKAVIFLDRVDVKRLDGRSGIQ